MATHIHEGNTDDAGFGFLSLPFEIRNKIYRHALHSRKKRRVILVGARDSTHDISVQLLRVSRQIYVECKPILYGENSPAFFYGNGTRGRRQSQSQSCTMKDALDAFVENENKSLIQTLWFEVVESDVQGFRALYQQLCTDLLDKADFSGLKRIVLSGYRPAFTPNRDNHIRPYVLEVASVLVHSPSSNTSISTGFREEGAFWTEFIEVADDRRYDHYCLSLVKDPDDIERWHRIYDVDCCVLGVENCPERIPVTPDPLFEKWVRHRG